MLYDAKAKRMIEGERPSGVVGFMSFTRFIDLLKSSGEISPRETITHIEINGGGFNFRFEPTPGGHSCLEQ